LPSKRPRTRFQDIVDNVDAIKRYTSGFDQEKFLSNDLTVDAVQYCLLRISEAAAPLPVEAKELAPNQPWTDISRIGNRLRHEYHMISKITLWQIIEEDLASLRNDCAKAITLLPDDPPI
jgi:uncharacterized protein with HEPN domain